MKIEPIYQRARILVVDDEPANTVVLAKMLAQAGFEEVMTLNDSAAVLDRCQSWDPDLVLLDLHMPEPNGFELLPRLRDLAGDRYLPILVLTADTTEDAKDRALAIGANDFVTKPFRYNETLLRIRNLLETRWLQEQVRRHSATLESQLRQATQGEQERQAWQREVSLIIERILDGGDGLTMVYQPVVDMVTGDVVGFESLARFSVAPLRSPDKWFADATEVGMGLALELEAIRRALSGSADLDPSVWCAVNASPSALRSPALRDTLAGAFADRNVVVEITEHEALEDYGPLQEALASLRARGARIAVDDTGSGYSSLRHIHNLRPDQVKLARSLTSGIDDDPVRQALASSLVSITGELGAVAVATGVETKAEADALVDLGVRFGQGHHFAEPSRLPDTAAVAAAAMG
ncbi:MAG: EAL domain-containing protein [Acidimicrobiia bacterium]|nr:EAL domain-containing protein [Acidimicrobiia bacterium]